LWRQQPVQQPSKQPTLFKKQVIFGWFYSWKVLFSIGNNPASGYRKFAHNNTRLRYNNCPVNKSTADCGSKKSGFMRKRTITAFFEDFRFRVTQSCKFSATLQFIRHF
jgi:hypothetical protein